MPVNGREKKRPPDAPAISHRLTKKGGQLRIIALGAIVLTVLLLAVGVGGAFWFYDYAWKPGPAISSETVVVEIPKGSSTRDIRRILAARRVIHDDIRFLLLTRFSGRAGRLQAGEFLLPTGARPGEILRLLSTAHSVEYRITIPEGKNIEEIARLFAERGWCDAERFISLCHNEAFITSLGMYNLNSLEGYLYPATYSIPKSMRSAEKIIAMMVGTFRNVWSELIEGRYPVPDRNRTVTLASMIEKETAAGFERPIIAGVFLNRLKKKMRLQSDPTVIYGAADFNGRITREMLRRRTPWNTYVIPALPIGAISNPGRAALKAVLEPAETDALYFVSMNNGTHKFSTTLREHNNAVNKYQRNRKRVKASKKKKRVKTQQKSDPAEEVATPASSSGAASVSTPDSKKR